MFRWTNRNSKRLYKQQKIYGQNSGEMEYYSLIFSFQKNKM
jgi:hypothetical protein